MMIEPDLHIDLFYPLGGRGSGHHGHAGRKGKVGGSSSTKSGGSKKKLYYPSRALIKKALSEADSIGAIYAEYSVEKAKLKSIRSREGYSYPSMALVNKFMFGKPITPITVRPGTGRYKYEIVEGHHRYYAAEMAGLSEMYVVYVR